MWSAQRSTSSRTADDVEAEQIIEPLLEPEAGCHKIQSLNALKQRPEENAALSSGRLNLDIQLVQRLWKLLAETRPWSSLLTLALITLLQALIAAQLGQIAGGYYKAFIDGNVAAFVSLAWRSALLYAATAVVASGEDAFVNWLALKWRVALTARIQEAYCQSYAFLWLQGQDVYSHGQRTGGKTCMHEHATHAGTPQHMCLCRGKGI